MAKDGRETYNFFNIQFTKKYSSNIPRLLRTINLVVVIKQSNLNYCFMVECRTVPWAKHGVVYTVQISPLHHIMVYYQESIILSGRNKDQKLVGHFLTKDIL